jgi:Nuclease-related domain
MAARMVKLRRADACVVCARALPIGAQAWWDRTAGTVTCCDCDVEEPLGDASAEAGEAGGSARRKYQQRREAREQLIRERHPRMGRALLALRKAPQGERSWKTGGKGEAILARTLESYCGDRVVLLHDRRVPGHRANIDHIAVTRTGVWVIDAKRYKDAVQVVGGAVPGGGTLRVAGYNKTGLVDGLCWQVELVAAAVATVDPKVAIHGALCFVAPVGALSPRGIPAVRRLEVRGCAVIGPGPLARRLNQKGDLSAEQRKAIASVLARRFPMA